jgi:hypothetical protein
MAAGKKYLEVRDGCWWRVSVRPGCWRTLGSTGLWLVENTGPGTIGWWLVESTCNYWIVAGEEYLEELDDGEYLEVRDYG